MKHIITLVKISLVMAVLYFLVKTDHLHIEKLLLLFQKPSLFLSLLLLVAFLMVGPSVIRWWLLLKAIGYRISLGRVMNITWIGIFFTTFIPGAISGDVVKGVYLYKNGPPKPRSQILATLLIDRVIGLFAILLLSSVSLLVGMSQDRQGFASSNLAIIVIVLLICLLAGALLVLFPLPNDPIPRLLNRMIFGQKLLRVHQALVLFRRHKLILITGLALSLVIQLTEAICFFFIARDLGSHVVLNPEWFGLIALGELSTVVPLFSHRPAELKNRYNVLFALIVNQETSR